MTVNSSKVSVGIHNSILASKPRQRGSNAGLPRQRGFLAPARTGRRYPPAALSPARREIRREIGPGARHYRAAAHTTKSASPALVAVKVPRAESARREAARTSPGGPAGAADGTSDIRGAALQGFLMAPRRRCCGALRARRVYLHDKGPAR